VRTALMMGIVALAPMLVLGQRVSSTPRNLHVAVENQADHLRLTHAQVFVHRMNADYMTLAPVGASGGEFEMSLEPGYYDVVVINSISIPWVKRIEITPAGRVSLTAELPIDHEHTQR